MDSATLTPMAWLVASQYLLYAAGWGLCAWLLRGQRAAAAHWGLFMLLLGAGFMLSTWRGEPRTFWPYAGSNMLFVASFVALRRGLETFQRLPPRDVEHAATLALAVVGFTLLGAEREHAPWRVMLAYGGIAWVLARAALGAHAALVAEFGRATARVQLLPAVVLVALFGSRTLRQAMDPGVALEMHRLTADNVGVLYAYLVGAAVFNLSFLSLITLRMVRRLGHLSRHDALTGLLNRRAMQEQLDRAWRRAQRHGRPLSVVLLDLDRFKLVNDQHGHPAGDAVLRDAARRFAQAARDTDIVARIGGEEFVALMPDTDLDGARQVGERLIDALRRQPIALPTGELACTASAGVSQALPADASPAAVLVRADKALYRAKSEGRDRVVCAEQA